MSHGHTFLIVMQLLLPLATAQDYFEGMCRSDDDCMAVRANSVCDTANLVDVPDPTNSSLTVEANLCVCATDYFAFDTSGEYATGECVYNGTFFGTACSASSDCQIEHPNALCEIRNIVANSDPAGDSIYLLFCRCDDGWMASDMADPLNPSGECRWQAGLRMLCDRVNTDCVVQNSTCVDDGSNQGLSRCRCSSGFITYQDPDTMEFVCRVILTSLDYPELCDDCEVNLGTCYANSTLAAIQADPAANYECDCPITQLDDDVTGEDCGKYLVNVSCVIADFTMRICYTPHPAVNFSDGAMLFADGYAHDEMCKGEDISADPEAAGCPAEAELKLTPEQSSDTRGCPAEAERKLTLELRSDRRDECGVREYRRTNRIIFEKTIVVTRGDVTDESRDVYFDVFCSMSTHRDSTFGGVAVLGRSGDNEGDHLEPELVFKVYNELNKEIPEYVTIQLGDMIRLGIELRDDGTYAAAHVLACTASTSPKLPDDDATTQVLLFDSCPAEKQRVFTQDNLWRMVSGQPNQLQTGLIESFKLSTGFEVFIHCRIKLCLKGREYQCGPVSCGGANSVGRRRRRQADNEDVDVTRRIIYADNEEEEDSDKIEMDKTGFVILISFLLIILIVLAILVVLLFIKLRSRGGQVEDFGGPLTKQQPYRFAIPRIVNSHMRI